MPTPELELSVIGQTIDAPHGRLASLLDRLVGPFRRGTPPRPRPATGFFTDTTICIGCKACEVACASNGTSCPRTASTGPVTAMTTRGLYLPPHGGMSNSSNNSPAMMSLTRQASGWS